MTRPATDARDGLLRDPLLPVHVWVLCAFWLPANLVLEPLGGFGSPASLVALAVLLLGVLGALRPGAFPSGFQPVALSLVVFTVATLVAYGVAQTRALTPLEEGGATRALLIYLGYIGLGLYTVWCVRSRGQLDRLLRLVVVGACVMAVMGIVQFITGVGPESYVVVPGLTLQEVEIDTSRSLFTRVQATTAHPIEFGVVLAVVLPLALHQAIHGLGGRAPTRAGWVPVVLLLVAIPMTVSRSSVLGVAVGAGLLAVTWPPRFRLNAAVGALVLLVAMRLTFPGLLGTLRSMFVFFGDDPSISGRTDDYPVVEAYIAQTPWLGRGLGTFVPEQYFFLDNEYLGILLTAGLLGLVAFLGLFVVAIGTGRGVYHHASDPAARSLGQALAAAAAVSAFTWVTYDGLAFRLNAGLAFVLMGAVGALWRLEVGRLRWGVGVDRSRPAIPALAPRRRPAPTGTRLPRRPVAAAPASRTARVPDPAS